jgi:branched-chain amino acid transport system permease protein
MEYFLHLLILFGIYAALGLGLNLITGFTGLVSVTHAAFFGIGAYTTALLAVRGGTNVFLAAGAGILCAVIVALVIGAILSRLKGDYYVLGTVSFSYLVFGVLINWEGLTRGPLGIAGIPKPSLFGFSFASTLSFALLCAAVLVGVYFIARFATRSSFGRVLKAIREDEQAIQVFGYRTFSYKLAVFALGAGMAAVAGSLFASYITFIDPTAFSVMESVFILAIIILGGLANLKGTLTGAAFLVILPELLRFIGFAPDIAGQMRQVVYGLLLVFLMLYRPQGLIGEYKL